MGFAILALLGLTFWAKFYVGSMWLAGVFTCLLMGAVVAATAGEE